MAHVTLISFAPVKGLGLSHPESVDLTECGVRADRRFFLTGEGGRLLNGKSAGQLVQVTAVGGADGATLELRFPDGSVVSGEVEPGELVHTDFYGQRVPGRVVAGPFGAALASFAGRTLRLVRAEGEVGGVDRGRRGSVSLVSTGSLGRLAEEGGVELVDSRRFRMLFMIEGVEAHEEDGWLGQEVAVGEALIRPNGLVGRCAVTTHDPDTGVPDLDTLRLLRAYRSSVPTDEPLPFGIWGEVLRPGRAAVGDEVSVAAARA